MHGSCRRADDGADKSCQNTDLPTVFTGEGAKTCSKGNAVDVALCRKRPRHVHAADKADYRGEHEQEHITERDGGYGARVLTVRGKGEGGKGYADRGAREADAPRQERENFG